MSAFTYDLNALPAAVITGSPDYLRPLHGAPGGAQVQLYAADLAEKKD